MKKIESKVLEEIAYKEILDNGMEVIIIPKKGFKKKYAIWATHFGSIDNDFIVPKTQKRVQIPDGVAHFLEHKMFGLCRDTILYRGNSKKRTRHYWARNNDV